MKMKVVVAVLSVLLFASTSFAYDRTTNYIKGCNFSKCAYKSVGQAIDESLENPRWASGKASDGELIVNVEGIVTWHGNRYRALMQFAPTQKGFKTNGLSLNWKVMSEDFKNTFISELCK